VARVQVQKLVTGERRVPRQHASLRQFDSGFEQIFAGAVPLEAGALQCEGFPVISQSAEENVERRCLYACPQIENAAIHEHDFFSLEVCDRAGKYLLFCHPIILNERGKESKIMWRKAIVVVAVVIGLIGSGYAMAADSSGKGGPQTICPVMGGKIDKNVYTDYQGKRIYFCCSGCPADFKKDPEKYMKKLEEQGVVLEKAPETK
jgi:YHS domain-containing protein